MKSVLRFTAAGLALATVGFASGAQAQAVSTTATADARAEILSTLNIQVVAGDSDLDFGQIAPVSGMTASGTATLSSDGNDTLTCSANLTCSGGSPAAPSFTVTGLNGSTVQVTIPTGATLNGPAAFPVGMVNTMAVGTITTDLSANPVVLTTGSATFNLGGTLTVAANQAPGVYVGTLALSVAYN